MKQVTIPAQWLQELIALCGPEDHELRERVMKSAAPAPADALATATGLPAQSVAASWKDHHTAQLVNQLRDCATTYGQTQQLRERIATIVAPLCAQLKAHQSVLQPAAPQAQADARDAAFEAVRQKFCKLQRYSFFLDDKGNVRRTPDYCGNWVEFEAVHTLFEPGSVDAAIAAAKGNEQ